MSFDDKMDTFKKLVRILVVSAICCGVAGAVVCLSGCDDTSTVHLFDD